MNDSKGQDRQKEQDKDKQDGKKRSLKELSGKDPDEALKRFLQTPKCEDDEDEESESEGESEDE